MQDLTAPQMTTLSTSGGKNPLALVFGSTSVHPISPVLPSHRNLPPWTLLQAVSRSVVSGFTWDEKGWEWG